METPASYQPVARRKVYEQVAEQLLGQIGARRLKPGDVLPPERELTESFGVGRSSIREALRMLESQGVISAVSGGVLRRRGRREPAEQLAAPDVHARRPSGIHDLFELRRILECEAAALAAERHDDAAPRRDGRGDRGDGGVARRRTAASGFIDADLRFHLAVAEATGNRLVLHSMQAVRDVVRRALMTVFVIPHSPESAVVEHRAIRAAIASGDPAPRAAGDDATISSASRRTSRRE